MKTKQLKKEMDKKRNEVIEEFQKRKNKDVHLQTGLARGYICDIKAGRKEFKNYDTILNSAEDMGI